MWQTPTSNNAPIFVSTIIASLATQKGLKRVKCLDPPRFLVLDFNQFRMLYSKTYKLEALYLSDALALL